MRRPAIKWAVALAVTVSVLAFGGVGTLPLLPAELIIAAAFVYEVIRQGWPRVGPGTSIVIGVLVFIPVLQLIPLPETLLGVLSPARQRFANELATATVPPLHLAASLSLSPYDTQIALLRLLLYAMVFLLGFALCDAVREGQATLPRVLIGLGIFEAIYGLVQYLTGWQYIFGYAKIYNTSMATGTYINYNHYAGLLEMILPFVLAPILLGGTGTGSPRGLKNAVARDTTGLWIVRASMFVLLFLALIFSTSRGGLICGAAGIAVLGALSIAGGRKKLVLSTAAALIVLSCLYATWVGFSPVAARFQMLAGGDQGQQLRPAIWRDTLRLIADYPVFGTGLGTYPWASFRYQTAALTMRYEHAHNDYLEFAADLGVPAALLLFSSLWFVAIRLARRSLQLSPGDRHLAAACAAAMIALLLHSLADFNLQIPANAMVFSWIAGTGMALTKRERW